MPDNTAELTDATWIVRTRMDTQGLGPSRPFKAAYYKLDSANRLIEFKDAEHKVVHAISADVVLDISRSE